MFLNQCSLSLGEYALISSSRPLPVGSQVLSMEKSLRSDFPTVGPICASCWGRPLLGEQQADVYRGNRTSRQMWRISRLLPSSAPVMHSNLFRQEADPFNVSFEKFAASSTNCHCRQTDAREPQPRCCSDATRLRTMRRISVGREGHPRRATSSLVWLRVIIFSLAEQKRRNDGLRSMKGS